MTPTLDTNFRVVGTLPGGAYTGTTMTPGALMKIIGRQCAVSFDAMMESYTRDSNGHWISRDEYEAREERREAGRAALAYEPRHWATFRAVGLSLGLAAVITVALLIGRAG